MHPVCRDKKNKLNFDCFNADEQLTFTIDYALAKVSAEAAYSLGYKCDVYGDLFRYGRGVEKNYERAYDLYITSGERQDEYYEVSINRMTQELLGLSDDALDSSGSLSGVAKRKIYSVLPNVGEIGRILTRKQFEELLGIVKK